MVGALMQLVAYGAQDVYLGGYDNNMFIKFRIYYKKHVISDIVKIEITKIEFVKFIKIQNNLEQIKNMFNNNWESIDCSNMYSSGYDNYGYSKSNLKKLPRFKNLDSFSKLKYFNCSKNNLTQIEKLKYINLIWLNCSECKIKSIPNHMRELEYFDISNNHLSGNLDFSSYPKLKYLIASTNSIKNISGFSNSLIYLDISNNQINKLDNLPSSLEYLIVVQNNILSRINFDQLVKLKYLDISINNLTNSNILDGLPYGIEYLNCSQCEISTLDNLPTSLNKLICINNNIKSLDMLPESLEYLDCDHNNITQLDNLPYNLSILICSSNKIINLNNLPHKLISIDCTNNKIESMCNLPLTLKYSNIKIDKEYDNFNFFNKLKNTIKNTNYLITSNNEKDKQDKQNKKDKKDKQNKIIKKMKKYSELAHRKIMKKV